MKPNPLYVEVAQAINQLSIDCFADGKTYNGKQWGIGNEEIKQKFGIDKREWEVCRNLAIQLYGVRR